LTGRNGEIGAQAKLASRRIGEFERTAANFLAGAVDKNLRRLEDGWLMARLAARGEDGKDSGRLFV
jgi:hypothetical protein